MLLAEEKNRAYSTIIISVGTYIQKFFFTSEYSLKSFSNTVSCSCFWV